MGSTGYPVPHEAFVAGQINLPPGTGGGCVMKGPFSNMTVHLGPHRLLNAGAMNSEDPFKDNPRCLRRDINGLSAKRWASLRNTTELILGNDKIEMFQAQAQGDRRYFDKLVGIHSGGHFTVLGDPGGDFYLSPGEPVFYLHHAQIDRAYWIWQNLEWENRQV
jgi:tyrosinase